MIAMNWLIGYVKNEVECRESNKAKITMHYNPVIHELVGIDVGEKLAKGILDVNLIKDTDAYVVVEHHYPLFRFPDGNFDEQAKSVIFERCREIWKSRGIVLDSIDYVKSVTAKGLASYLITSNLCIPAALVNRIIFRDFKPLIPTLKERVEKLETLVNNHIAYAPGGAGY